MHQAAVAIADNIDCALQIGWTPEQRDVAALNIERVVKERDAWKCLALNRGILNNAYRLRKRTVPETAFKAIEFATKQLADLGIKV